MSCHEISSDVFFISNVQMIMIRSFEQILLICFAGVLQTEMGILRQDLGHGVGADGLLQDKHKNRLMSFCILGGRFRINKYGYHNLLSHSFDYQRYQISHERGRSCTENPRPPIPTATVPTDSLTSHSNSWRVLGEKFKS